MDTPTLRELLAPFIPAAELDDLLLASIQVHLDLLLRWNQRINLTALRSPEEMVVRHFGESLFAARQLFPRDSQQDVFDLGSGAGFPGLPMKYWAPRLQLTLIEGHGKKATFLREVGRALHLTGLTILNLRAESLAQPECLAPSASPITPASPRQASLVTMRAVEKFDHALLAAAKLVADAGRLAILIGDSQRQRALSLLPPGEVTITDLPASEHRILLIWKPSTSTS